MGDGKVLSAVIFDLDGVLVSTDGAHYQAWKRMADEEGIPFNEADNDRLRGVSRMACVDIILEKSRRTYSPQEKLALAERKNGYYQQLIQRLSPADLLPGAQKTITGLKQQGIKMAIGSSSRNAPVILERIGLADSFDAVADGNQISRSKPDPEVFLLAAAKMQKPPQECLVVEDALSGIDAALAAGMQAFAVGTAMAHPLAHVRARSLDHIDLAAYITQRNALLPK